MKTTNITLTEARNETIKKMEEMLAWNKSNIEREGYVVMGYINDGSFYAYVGKGNGYKGAALLPMASHPVVFDRKIDAKREANNGTYRNGAGEVIRLFVMNAGEYFSIMSERLQKHLEMMKDTFAKH